MRDDETMDEPWLGILEVLQHAGNLKQLTRQGWLDRGVRNSESVADHSYRLALLTLLIAARDPTVDPSRAVILALVHDLPEAMTGDVTPFDQQLRSEELDKTAIFRGRPVYSEAADRAKRIAEQDAIRQMSARLPSDLAQLLIGAWEEYETGTTAEARLVRQLDKLETWLQALEYQQQQPEIVIESFRLGTGEAVTDPKLRSLLAAITRQFGDARHAE